MLLVSGLNTHIFCSLCSMDPTYVSGRLMMCSSCVSYTIFNVLVVITLLSTRGRQEPIRTFSYLSEAEAVPFSILARGSFAWAGFFPTGFWAMAVWSQRTSYIAKKDHARALSGKKTARRRMEKDKFMRRVGEE